MHYQKNTHHHQTIPTKHSHHRIKCDLTAQIMSSEINMNFNRWPAHQIKILKQYIFKFIPSILICSGLNGCDSYSTNLCDNFAKTITYKDNANNVYIDIIGRESYDNAELHSILVEKVSNKKNSIESNTYYWSLNSLATRKMGDGTINDFPIRYGITLPGTRAEIPARTLNNGNYKILGFAMLYKNNKRCNKKLKGEFILTNGKSYILTPLNIGDNHE